MKERSMRKFFEKNDRVCIIAEVAQTHEGSLGLAHAFIDAVANTGVDAIKFQTHIADKESTPNEPFRVNFSYEDKCRYDYWKRMEFTEEQWAGLYRHAQEKDLIFLSSPFSVEALEMLDRIGVNAWKIGSGEFYNDMLIEKILTTGKPILLSTGLASIAEIDFTVNMLNNHQAEFAIFQCTSEYPCPPEKIGLNLIPFFTERYGCPVGLSDHSGTIFPSLAAVAFGAKFLEVHVSLCKEMFGPDVKASVTISEITQLAEGVRYIEKILSNPVNKDDLSKRMLPLKNMFTKSIVFAKDLPKGTVLDASMIAVKKPGGGMSPSETKNVLGKRLKVDVRKNELLKKDYLEEETGNS